MMGDIESEKGSVQGEVVGDNDSVNGGEDPLLLIFDWILMCLFLKFDRERAVFGRLVKLHFPEVYLF